MSGLQGTNFPKPYSIIPCPKRKFIIFPFIINLFAIKRHSCNRSNKLNELFRVLVPCICRKTISDIAKIAIIRFIPGSAYIINL